MIPAAQKRRNRRMEKRHVPIQRIHHHSDPGLSCRAPLRPSNLCAGSTGNATGAICIYCRTCRTRFATNSSSYGTIGTIQAGSCQSFQRASSSDSTSCPCSPLLIFGHVLTSILLIVHFAPRAIHCLLEASGSAGLLGSGCDLLRFAEFLFLPEHCFSLTNVMALSHVHNAFCHTVIQFGRQSSGQQHQSCSALLVPHLDWSWHRSSSSRSQLEDLHQSHCHAKF